MRASGYQLTIHATINVIFDDDTLHPSDGQFYIKSIQCEDDDDGTKILSNFSECSKNEESSRSLVLADFWEEGIVYSWHKDDDDFDYWVVNVRGKVVVEPQNPPEDWVPCDGELTLLELEFRRDGDSPPEKLFSTKFEEGWVENVIPMIKDKYDDWVELEDDE